MKKILTIGGFIVAVVAGSYLATAAVGDAIFILKESYVSLDTAQKRNAAVVLIQEHYPNVTISSLQSFGCRLYDLHEQAGTAEKLQQWVCYGEQKVSSLTAEQIFDIILAGDGAELIFGGDTVPLKPRRMVSDANANTFTTTILSQELADLAKFDVYRTDSVPEASYNLITADSKNNWLAQVQSNQVAATIGEVVE